MPQFLNQADQNHDFNFIERFQGITDPHPLFTRLNDKPDEPLASNWVIFEAIF